MIERKMIINGFPNYAITNTGKVINIKKQYEQPQYKSEDGYMCVQLNNNGKKAEFKVHRLVAVTFIENPYDEVQIIHIDGNKKNNCVTNLKWANNKDSKNNIPVKITSEGDNKTYIFYSIGECSNYLGVNKSSLSRALKERKGFYHGFFIEYLY